MLVGQGTGPLAAWAAQKGAERVFAFEGSAALYSMTRSYLTVCQGTDHISLAPMPLTACNSLGTCLFSLYTCIEVHTFLHSQAAYMCATTPL